MQPLDDRTTCYTLIFLVFWNCRPDPTRPAGRPDPRVDPTRVQLWLRSGKRLRLNTVSSLLRFEECRRSKQTGLNSPAWAALPAGTGTTTSTSATTPAAAAHNCCEVCLIGQRDGVTLVPCGHARFCATCVYRFVTMCTGCPICRAEQMVMRVYILKL